MITLIDVKKRLIKFKLIYDKDTTKTKKKIPKLTLCLIMRYKDYFQIIVTKSVKAEKINLQ